MALRFQRLVADIGRTAITHSANAQNGSDMSIILVERCDERESLHWAILETSIAIGAVRSTRTMSQVTDHFHPRVKP